MKIPPNPSDVIWENLETSRSKFWLRILLVLIMVLALMACYYLVIQLLHVFRQQNLTPQHKANPAFFKYCDERTSFEEVKKIKTDLFKWIQANPDLTDPRFFKEKSQIKIMKNLGFKIEPPETKDESIIEYPEYHQMNDDSELLRLCFCHRQASEPDKIEKKITSICPLETQAGMRTRIFSITLLSGALISLVNFILIRMMPSLISLIPFESLTAHQSVVILCTVPLLYLNSIIVPIFISSSSGFRFFQPERLKKLHSSSFFASDIYFDFYHEWYADIGIKIMLSLIINIFFFTIFDLILSRTRIR